MMTYTKVIQTRKKPALIFFMLQIRVGAGVRGVLDVLHKCANCILSETQCKRKQRCFVMAGFHYNKVPVFSFH